MRTVQFRLLSVALVGVLTFATALALSAAENAKASDLLTAKQVKELVANAKTPADHMKLSKHFAAEAAKYEADADEHKALAEVYRSVPSASETKRPGTPDTAAHCDRFAQLTRDAAKEARALAAAHEHMAAGK